MCVVVVVVVSVLRHRPRTHLRRLTHLLYVPSTSQVRASKDIFVTQTLAQFSSVTDQVLHDVFGCPVMETPAGRVCAHVSDAMKGRKRLARQKFPYRLPKGTRHYVMW